MLHLKSVFRFCGFSAQLIAPFCRVLKPPTGRAKTWHHEVVPGKKSWGRIFFCLYQIFLWSGSTD